MSIKQLTVDNKPFQYSLFFGGIKKGCVNINIDAPESGTINSRYMSIMNPSIASIPYLSYSPDCSLEPTLQPREGTRHMIKTALAITCKQFPFIEMFKFDDASTFICDGLKISLSHYYVALHGKTWYEENFHAELVEPAMQQKYLKAVKCFSDPSSKAPIFMPIFLDTIANPDDKNIVLSVYNSSSTSIEFFKRLKQEYPQNFCRMTYSWLERYINHTLGFNFLNQSWLIKKKNLNANVARNALYDELKEQQGGNLNKDYLQKHRSIYNMNQCFNFAYDEL